MLACWFLQGTAMGFGWNESPGSEPLPRCPRIRRTDPGARWERVRVQKGACLAESLRWGGCWPRFPFGAQGLVWLGHLGRFQLPVRFLLLPYRSLGVWRELSPRASEGVLLNPSFPGSPSGGDSIPPRHRCSWGSRLISVSLFSRPACLAHGRRSRGSAQCLRPRLPPFGFSPSHGTLLFLGPAPPDSVLRTLLFLCPASLTVLRPPGVWVVSPSPCLLFPAVKTPL